LERVGHLGAAAPALVEIEDVVTVGERGQVGPNGLEVEAGAAVEDDEGVARRAVEHVVQLDAAGAGDEAARTVRRSMGRATGRSATIGE
jgi:hypothetical protein